MIYLLFAFLFALLYLYFRHREKKSDYILIAFAVALLFLEGATWLNTGIYDKIGYNQVEDCIYTYQVNSTLVNTTSCTTSYKINFNATQGYFDVNDYFAFKASNSNILHLSGFMLYFILIVGTCYIAYKGLKLENFIR